MKKHWAIITIVVAVCACYAPALRNGFVWDDAALIIRDPLIRSWRLIPEGFQHFLFTDATASDFYRPLQRLTYTLDYWAFAFRPGPYHLTSILWHLAAALALFLFANELLRLFDASERSRRWISFLATLVWAIHPVHSGAVVYISGRADPIAAAFGFLGLFCGLRMLRATNVRVWFWAAVATVAFLLSALSKELGFVFPLLWLVLLALRRNWSAMRYATLAIVFVTVTYLSLRLPAEHTPTPAPAVATPLLVRPILIARAAAEYGALLAFPWHLHMERDVETRPTGFNPASVTEAARRELQTLLGIILIAAGIYWMVRARSIPALFCCLLLAAISYLPVSGIFLLNASVAEHWLYLPSAFLFLAVFLTANLVLDPERGASNALTRKLFVTVSVVWVLFHAGRTFIRTFDWKDQRVFLEKTIASGGDSARMLINLGGLDHSRGHLDAAKEHLQTALRKEPDQPFAIINLAAVVIKESDFKSAHELLARATQMPLVAAQAHDLLAVLEHRETGNVNLLRLRLAARTGPPMWVIEKRYIRALAEAGHLERAIEEARHCLRTEWYRAESWQLLSELLDKLGRREEASQARAIARKYDVHLAPNVPAS